MQSMLGEYLKGLREDRRFTLRQVEKETGISNSYLSQIERGERGIPHMRLLTKLANAYGTDLGELLFYLIESAPSFETFQPIEVPAPTDKFIAREYQKLSDENKGHLKAFLQFLVKKEEEGKPQIKRK